MKKLSRSWKGVIAFFLGFELLVLFFLDHATTPIGWLIFIHGLLLSGIASILIWGPSKP